MDNTHTDTHIDTHTDTHIDRMTEIRRREAREYYHLNLEAKREQGRRNYAKYYHTSTGKEKKAAYRRDNRQLLTWKQSARYAMKRDANLEGFSTKYPQRADVLRSVGFLQKLENRLPQNVNQTF